MQQKIQSFFQNSQACIVTKNEFITIILLKNYRIRTSDFPIKKSSFNLSSQGWEGFC